MGNDEACHQIHGWFEWRNGAVGVCDAIALQGRDVESAGTLEVATQGSAPWARHPETAVRCCDVAGIA